MGSLRMKQQVAGQVLGELNVFLSILAHDLLSFAILDYTKLCLEELSLLNFIFEEGIDQP